MNVAAEVMGMILAFHRATHFEATVVGTSGTTVLIQRDGAAIPDGQYYQGADGVAAAVAPGDRVLVIDKTGDGMLIVVAKMP